MYCRDIALLSIGARRIRTLRWLLNFASVAVLACGAIALLGWLIPDWKTFWFVLLIPIGVITTLCVIPWFLIGAAFTLGLVKCPCCGQTFARGASLWVMPICESCGFDVVSIKRPGDF